MEYQIRLAKREELDEIYSVEVDAFSESGGYSYMALRQLFDLCPDYCFVAETDRLIGYVLGAMVSSGSHGWMLNLAVCSHARRMGVGKALSKVLIEALSSGGASSISLTVSPSNSSAIRLYNQLGFVHQGIHPNYFGPGIDKLIMENTMRS